MKSIVLKRPHKISINLLGLNLVFSVFYWIMESTRDVIVFGRHNIFKRIFAPDPMSFWMRMLVIFIFILFSALSYSLREKIEVHKARLPRSADRFGIILVGFGFGFLYWILESFRDAFVFGKGNFLQRIFSPEPMGFWMRILVVFILFLFSMYAQSLVNKQRDAEEKYKKTSTELESVMAVRTTELTSVNNRLVQEIAERERAEIEIRRVNRILETLSACNEVTIRAGEESNLLKNICNTLSGIGGYPLVWISFAERNEGLVVRPVIRCTSQTRGAGYQEANTRGATLSRLVTEDFADKKNPIGESMRSGNPGMVKFFSNHADGALWVVEAVAQGYAALLSLPLKAQGEVFGTLAIFSQNPNAFDMEELGFLEKLTGNLAFGITVLRTRNERDQAQLEKEKMQVQLLHSHKMEAVGILAGGIAHDFNNMLTAIQVSADLAMMEVSESSPVYKILKEIHGISMHAADMARQLLLFSRKHPMEYTTLDFNAAIGAVQKILRRLLGEDIAIQVEFGSGLWATLADRSALEQVILNLAVNARDAMPDGGNLTLQTQNAILDDVQAALMPDARPGRFVRLTVTDTGVGMTRDVLDRIFEPFFSTKGLAKGAGLGLSVVYGIVKQHEGWISVESRIGKGTTFDIYLPATSLEIPLERCEERPTGAHQGHGERILMVEDDEKIREFAEKGLARSGYAVFATPDAQNARRLFIEERGNFDLVFSDVVLPDRNGIELVDEMVMRNPALRVLFTSGYTDHKSQWPVIEERGFKYLPKPFGLADLLKSIRNVLDKGVVRSSMDA